MEVLILSNRYTYLLGAMLNSGVMSSFTFKPKVTRLLYPSPIFPIAVLLTNLNFIIVPLHRKSCKEQVLGSFLLPASASVYITRPNVATLDSSHLNLHEIALLLQLASV